MHIGIISILATAWLVSRAVAQIVPVCGTNATWAYFKGTTEASLPDRAAWRGASFADTAWTRGPAPFFYGEPLTGGTLLNDMQNVYSTLFLRRPFVITNATDIASLELNAACDDGFLAWINGVEVVRFRAPAGEPAFNSFASENAVPDPATFGPFPLPDPGAYLMNGTNVLAVQIFNVSRASSDLVFDAALSATLAERVAPVVTAVAPAAGPLTQLGTITVTFSEPVTGVDAADLMLNEIPCPAVSGSGTTYTFTCPAIPLGTVSTSWDPQAGIVDRSLPPVPFDPRGPGARWLYELYDPTVPRLTSTYPAAGATVRQLDRAEVVFSREVTGVDAADLLLNGQPATNVLGAGAGPYLFEFSQGLSGEAVFAWAHGHGITDQASDPVAFGGGSWQAFVNPALPRPDVIINEIMAENVSGLADENGDREDWIELYNRSTNAVNLAGWSLTDDARWPRPWVFPATVMPPRTYLRVFASGKDRRVAGANLHTNFKLAIDGEYLGLFDPDSLREAASELAPEYPEQRPDYAYGRNGLGEFRYLLPGTPGAANVAGALSQTVREVHFSATRGFYSKPFNLTLACETAGAVIRYTTNGSLPALTNGFVYTQPIVISATRIIRAAAFRENMLPSKVGTHTFLYNLPASRRLLPALSVVTATNHLYGRNGIMEVNPRNTTKSGLAWERPVSVELIRPDDQGGFQSDCGMRVHGGGYIRSLYDYRTTALPQGKYSFRLYFRGDYGAGRLEYPWFPETTQASFDTIVLRAGMNDHTNPFLIDEFVRTLARDCGQPSPVGTFVGFFLNGVYKGNYNPCERIDVDYLRAYHGGDDKWDVVAQMGEVREGDLGAWNSLKSLAATRNLAITTNYLEVARRLDLTNFVDYLAPLIYVDNDDWPHNNWRAARQRTGNGPFRLYVWDAEWACGIVNGHAPSANTITSQLSSTAPPWGSPEIAQIFNKLKVTREFKLLFADRMHRHLFNGGALTDARIRARYEETKARLNGAVSGFNNAIGTRWIPNRRRYFLDHLTRAGFLSSSNAPAFSPFGGRFAPGLRLTMTNLTGTIYYTLDGSDPRTMFTGDVSPSALVYRATEPPVLSASTWVKARTYWVSNTFTPPVTNWSALTEAVFQVDLTGRPIRISEINYHPPGSEAYEFIEIVNLSPLPMEIGGVSLLGVDFRFPVRTTLAGGARLVIASDANPALFEQRYPGLTVAGWFGGNLSNSGERVALLDPDGQVITSVDYGDGNGWPVEADGDGPSLEALDPGADPDDPANWIASSNAGGSPGAAGTAPSFPPVRINEIAAAVSVDTPCSGLTNDWIELHNAGGGAKDLAGWSLSDGSSTMTFASVSIPAGGYLVVHARPHAVSGTLHTGFALRASGEAMFLTDPAGRRVDSVGFGLQIPAFSLARLGAEADWQLAEPTPGGPNEPTEMGDPASVVINEFLPNALAGEDDWIELYNRDQARPVSLKGMGLAATNASQRLDARSFIAPAGFAVIRADGNPGADHVEFKLPAARGYVALIDRFGAEVQRLPYLNALEGVSIGMVPDGVGTAVPLPASASPGAPNYKRITTSVRFNEVLAASRTNASDWVELFNPTAEAVDLAGMSLAVDTAEPGQWFFPVGASLPAGAYLVIAGDPSRPASTANGPVLNCGRALSASGGGVYLFNTDGQWVDLLEFGFQLPDQSVGPGNGAWLLLSSATPGAANASPATLADSLNARLNEWKAGGEDDDWIEIYNREALPINLGGCVLTDDPSIAGQTNHLIRPLTFVPPGGWVRWIADGNADQGPDHLPFKLHQLGETIRLYRPDFVVADSIDYGPLAPGMAQGRFPDGATNIVNFPATASPGAPNWLPLPHVAINEVLAHTDPPLEDAIELVNLGVQPVAIGGWWLSNDRRNPRLFQVPAGTVLDPGGFKVYYQAQFEPTPGSPTTFRLDPDREGEVVLSQAGPDGALTGYRSMVNLGASFNGVSFGRHRTSVGDDYTFLTWRTFGVDYPGTLAEFRVGQGLANSAPLIGPVVINEIMYHPAAAASESEEDLEFVELHNLTDQTQPLWELLGYTNFWRLRGGIEYEFSHREPVLPPHSYLLVVGFNPFTNAPAMTAFLNHYRLSPAAADWIYGPFQGRLANSGELLTFERPGHWFNDGAAVFIPRIRVDHVAYGTAGSWSPSADGAGLSLQRLQPGAYGNDPASWQAAWPTPGAANANAGGDADGDGLPDDWEAVHGLDAFSAAGASGALGDPDEDGFTNREEFQAGTDPRTITIRIAALGLEGTSIRIRFNAAGGAAYRVEYSNSITSPAWVNLGGYGPQPITGPAEASLPLPSQSSARYFRVVLNQ